MKQKQVRKRQCCGSGSCFMNLLKKLNNLKIFVICGYYKDKSTTFPPPLLCCGIGDLRSGIRDPGWIKLVMIRDKHSRSATLK
jgi:hypothetical protein